LGIFDKLRAEFVDIIEWIDDSSHTLVWRFPRYHNQIKNNAQLIVRPGQQAIFVNKGQIADIFEPGMYTLSTDNLPILSTLQGWPYGFDSPFKCEVYFVSTRQLTDLKWGTSNPIMLRDADFGPIRLRAFGTYSLRAIDAKILLTELVGTDGQFEAEEVTTLLRSIIISSFTDMLGEKSIPALDLASKYRELSQGLKEYVCERIDDEYGLEVPELNIVNISLPPEVEKAIDQRSSMGIIGDMGKFQQFQSANAMMAAAENTSGGASEGVGLGMGMLMAGQMMGGGMGAAMQAPTAAPAAPPPPPVLAFHVTANGQTMGPFSMDQMRAGAQAGQINGDSLVWSQGMASWAAAKTVPALAALFQAAPPPPPPPPAPPSPQE